MYAALLSACADLKIDEEGALAASPAGSQAETAYNLG
jgi:hypothetical protein